MRCGIHIKWYNVVVVVINEKTQQTPRFCCLQGGEHLAPQESGRRAERESMMEAESMVVLDDGAGPSGHAPSAAAGDPTAAELRDIESEDDDMVREDEWGSDKKGKGLSEAERAKLAFLNAKRRQNEKDRILSLGWTWSASDAVTYGTGWHHPVHGYAASKKAIFKLHKGAKRPLRDWDQEASELVDHSSPSHHVLKRGVGVQDANGSSPVINPPSAADHVAAGALLASIGAGRLCAGSAPSPASLDHHLDASRDGAPAEGRGALLSSRQPRWGEVDGETVDASAALSMLCTPSGAQPTHASSSRALVLTGTGDDVADELYGPLSSARGSSAGSARSFGVASTPNDPEVRQAPPSATAPPLASPPPCTPQR